LAAPWILFEAGALSKAFTASAVVPYLVDVDYRQISGPLAQFQAKKADRMSTRELVYAINARHASPIEETRLEQLFSVLWSRLEGDIRAVPPLMRPPVSRSESEVLEDLVQTVRRLEKRIELADVDRASPPSVDTSYEVYLFGSFPHHRDGACLNISPERDLLAELAITLQIPIAEYGVTWVLIDELRKAFPRRAGRDLVWSQRHPNKFILRWLVPPKKQMDVDEGTGS
jgi:hypothetical protein